MTENTQMTPENFREQLGRILLLAEQQENRISREEVRAFFEESALTEEQLQLVCDFLLSRKVIVSGYGEARSGSSPAEHTDREDAVQEAALQDTAAQDDTLRQAGNPGLLPEESRWLELYREELSAISPAKEGERQQLLVRLRQAEEQAASRLTELMLPAVLEAALRMDRGQVLLQDLVQEGNLQLLLAGARTDWRMIMSAEMAEEKLIAAALDAMRALAAEQAEMHTQDRKMVEKAENLKDGIAVLKEELGRGVYLDEVAEFLSMTEEEAEDILRLTGEEPAEEE